MLIHVALTLKKEREALPDSWLCGGWSLHCALSQGQRWPWLGHLPIRQSVSRVGPLQTYMRTASPSQRDPRTSAASLSNNSFSVRQPEANKLVNAAPTSLKSRSPTPPDRIFLGIFRCSIRRLMVRPARWRNADILVRWKIVPTKKSFSNPTAGRLSAHSHMYSSVAPDWTTAGTSGDVHLPKSASKAFPSGILPCQTAVWFPQP